MLKTTNIPKPGTMPKVPFTLVLVEVILAILFVYELFQIVLLKIEGESITVSFTENPTRYLVFGLTAVLLILIYIILMKKQPLAYKAQKEAPSLIKEVAKQKLTSAKQDTRVIALLMLQFAFVIVIVMSIALYLDPETNIVPFPWNVIGFIAFVGISIWLYHYTKFFRIR